MGSVSVWFFGEKHFTGDTEVLSTVSGMPFDICDEGFSFKKMKF